jgi:hypothetical protein
VAGCFEVGPRLRCQIEPQEEIQFTGRFLWLLLRRLDRSGGAARPTSVEKLRRPISRSYSDRWRLFFEPEMGSVLMVVADILRKEPIQVALIESNDMIQ